MIWEIVVYFYKRKPSFLFSPVFHVISNGVPTVCGSLWGSLPVILADRMTNCGDDWGSGLSCGGKDNNIPGMEKTRQVGRWKVFTV